MWWMVAVWAAPPEGIDPEDVSRWEAGSEALLAGPRGCWDFAGRIAMTAVSYSPASRWMRSGRTDHVFVGSFVGRLEDGAWSSFAYDLSPADAPGEPAAVEFPVFPGVGRLGQGIARRTNPPSEDRSEVSADLGSEEATNLLKQVLDDLDASTATSYAEWRDADGAVHLFQDVPVSKSPKAETVTIETTFPAGGTATGLDAVFPRRMKLGDGLVKVSVLDAQLHLRGQPAGDVVLPAVDSLSLGIGALGFTVAYEQKLVFETATRCP